MASIWSGLRGIVLQILIPASLLFFAWQKSQQAQNLVSTIFRGAITLSSLVKILVAIISLNLTRRLNAWASRRGLNNHIFDSWDWSREIVLITGGSSGIGAAIIERLSAKGIKVANIDLQPPKSTQSANVRFFHADITSPSAVHAAGESIRKSLGEPTVLINNAGYGSWTPILSVTYESVRKTFDVNLLSHWTMVKEFVPNMVRHDHGHVISIASMASFVTVAGNVDYSATKAGVLAFHEGLAQELKWREGTRKIRTSVVHPTWARTPLLDSVSQKFGRDFTEQTVSADDVADAVVDQLLKGESGQIFVPSGASWLAGIRGFPTWMAEGFRDMSKAALAEKAG
ncbi:MAG: hypothetical protein Q9227_004126 [Pyrenula ochraceoflavens]